MPIFRIAFSFRVVWVRSYRRVLFVINEVIMTKCFGSLIIEHSVITRYCILSNYRLLIISYPQFICFNMGFNIYLSYQLLIVHYHLLFIAYPWFITCYRLHIINSVQPIRNQPTPLLAIHHLSSVIHYLSLVIVFLPSVIYCLSSIFKRSSVIYYFSSVSL